MIFVTVLAVDLYSCAVTLCVRENRDGWLVACGLQLCECMRTRSSAVSLLSSVTTNNHAVDRIHMT